MEPLHPDLRKALKEAHPRLTDAVIDRVEELQARRFQLDPSTQAEAIAKLERERLELIEKKMPRYTEVAQVFAGRRSPARPRPAAVVVIKKTR